MAEKLGKTGEYPEGKISSDDEGALNMAVGSDPDQRLVRIEFGTPVAWLAMPPELARDLANTILKHCDRLNQMGGFKDAAN